MVFHDFHDFHVFHALGFQGLLSALLLLIPKPEDLSVAWTQSLPGWLFLQGSGWYFCGMLSAGSVYACINPLEPREQAGLRAEPCRAGLRAGGSHCGACRGERGAAGAAKCLFHPVPFQITHLLLKDGGNIAQLVKICCWLQTCPEPTCSHLLNWNPFFLSLQNGFNTSRASCCSVQDEKGLHWNQILNFIMGCLHPSALVIFPSLFRSWRVRFRCCQDKVGRLRGVCVCLGRMSVILWSFILLSLGALEDMQV